MKHTWLKKYAAGIMLASIALTGCGDSEEEEKIQTEFKQDEVAYYKDINFTINSVEKSAGIEYDTPKEGCEYVIVNVTIENKSEEKISYNPYDWKMENSQGQETDQTIVLFNSDTQLNSGDLKSGGKVSGTLVFEQPVGDPELKLNYYDTMFNEEASISISIE